MSIMISTPLVIGPGSVTAEMINSGVAAVGQVLTADGAGGADFAAPAGGSPGYLEYVALLTQTGTSAPVATVLKNTLSGTVVWTRDSSGTYNGTLMGAFTPNKTVSFVGQISAIEGNLSYSVINTNVNAIFLMTGDVFIIDTNGPIGVTATDGMLNSTPVEIRVYP